MVEISDDNEHPFLNNKKFSLTPSNSYDYIITQRNQYPMQVRHIKRWSDKVLRGMLITCVILALYLMCLIINTCHVNSTYNILRSQRAIDLRNPVNSFEAVSHSQYEQKLNPMAPLFIPMNPSIDTSNSTSVF